MNEPLINGPLSFLITMMGHGRHDIRIVAERRAATAHSSLSRAPSRLCAQRRALSRARTRIHRDNAFRRFIIPPPTCRINHRPAITDVLTSDARARSHTRGRFHSKVFKRDDDDDEDERSHRRVDAAADFSFAIRARVVPRAGAFAREPCNPAIKPCVTIGNGATRHFYDALPHVGTRPRNRASSHLRFSSASHEKAEVVHPRHKRRSSARRISF